MRKRKLHKSGVIIVVLLIVALLFIRPVMAFMNRFILLPVNLKDGNVKAFLDTLRWCEGTASANGYRMLFGGSLFTGFTDHPRITKYYGSVPTTAAGAYQFIWPTWDRVRKKLNLPDFSPTSQDTAAVQLIAERGAYDDVVAGRIDSALKKCSAEWASLPYSTYGQPTKKLSAVLDKFRSYGGVIKQ